MITPLIWAQRRAIQLKKALDEVQGLLSSTQEELEATLDAHDEEIEQYNRGFQAAAKGKPLPQQTSRSFSDGYKVRRYSKLEKELKEVRDRIPDTLTQEGRLAKLSAQVVDFQRRAEEAEAFCEQLAKTLHEKNEELTVVKKGQRDWMENAFAASDEARSLREERDLLQAKTLGLERAFEQQNAILSLGPAIVGFVKAIILWAEKQGFDEIGIADLFALDIETYRVLRSKLKE